MEEKLETAEKKVLVQIVRFAQKKKLEGTRGGWKDFLAAYDKKFGASLSDPSKRSNDVLVSFLKTFTKDDDLKLFDRMLQGHSNRKTMEQFSNQSPNDESPEQRLVRLTMEHPQYLLDYTFPTGEEGWIVTKLSRKSPKIKSTDMVAVDCEMVLCEDGTEALVRVCVVDRDLQVKIDELVNPNKTVADYRTEITGVAAGDLEGVTCSLADIQKSMKKLLSGGTILVGHSLHNDLQVLKIDHARVIDTSYIFKYSNAPDNRRPSLNNLCKSFLGYEVRKPGAAHNCLDDACAAMKLVLAKLQHGDIPLVEEVSQAQMEKLLLHKIPNNVPTEEISRVIPGDVAIEIKPSKKAQSRHYSAFAIFNSPEEANRAFENIEGTEEQDWSGLRQKLVKFQFGKGVTVSLYIRKMVSDDFQCQVPANKRKPESEKSTESKRLKTDQKTLKETAIANSSQLDDHLKEIERLKQELKEKDLQIKEIERLKQELKEKDLQITVQDKIISNLQKRVDELKKGRK